MLAVAALAVLLAGDTPDTQEAVSVLPVGTTFNDLVTLTPAAPRARPLRIELAAGLASTTLADPFGRTGVSTFHVPAPLAGARLRGQSWYLDFAGQLARSTVTNRNVSASVGRDVLSIGRTRWGLHAEYADVRFRREDYRSGDVGIGTNRAATLVDAGISFGLGPYRGSSARLTLLGGWYKNRYGSIVELPGFTGDEPLADDELYLYGGTVSVDSITVGDRIEFGGSLRYLQLHGGHAAALPDSELSGTVVLNIRLFGVGRKRLSVGGIARFGPAGPSIISDRTFGLRGIWRLR